MTQQPDQQLVTNPQVTITEVNRVLEVGHLLLSVLTPEELDHLQRLFHNQDISGAYACTPVHSSDSEIGNTSVT